MNWPDMQRCPQCNNPRICIAFVIGNDEAAVYAVYVCTPCRLRWECSYEVTTRAMLRYRLGPVRNLTYIGVN